MALDQTHHSLPLLSRLDHLDFMMKYLEGKGASMVEENGRRWRREGERESKLMPMDLALKETFFKGSLLDRVVSLENRLFQLCLDMDQTTGSSSSSYKSMGEPSSSSYPIFSHSNGEINDDKEKSSIPKEKVEKKKNKKVRMDEKSLKNLKRIIPWPHLKILGC